LDGLLLCALRYKFIGSRANASGPAVPVPPSSPCNEEIAVETYSRLKEGAKWMWSLGDYREVAERLYPCAAELAVAADIGVGMMVLDVAAGNGNFAIAAARRGATVTATDLTPRMVALGRARSEADSLAIAWQEADAEALPFATGCFDAAASVFGAMFAPQPERVAAELFRVVRPGGIVAMANYASEGFLGRFAALITTYAPPAPAPLPSPFAWGDADEVCQRFTEFASAITVERRTLTFTFDTPEQGLAFWERTNGPLIALHQLVPPDTYRTIAARTADLLAELNRAEDGRVILDSAYLQVVARKCIPA
jgi:ubiquinone/menaquinone biosynthesis C-methylase UbiE